MRQIIDWEIKPIKVALCWASMSAKRLGMALILRHKAQGARDRRVTQELMHPFEESHAPPAARRASPAHNGLKSPGREARNRRKDCFNLPEFRFLILVFADAHISYDHAI
jgi:hypothetical protein